MRKLILILLLLPIGALAQKTLSGVWTGALTNDSTQARNDQTFELALTEYRGKVYGYSYATFLENDHLYYIVKRVEGTIVDGVCEVTDDELVSTNLFTKLDKRVKRTITFRMNPVDSIWRLDGTWKTNKTREFYAITGKIALKEEKDLNKSRVYEHLGDLGLQKSLAWDKKEEPKQMVIIKVEDVASAKKEKVKEEKVKKPKEEEVAKVKEEKAKKVKEEDVSTAKEEKAKKAKEAETNRKEAIAQGDTKKEAVVAKETKKEDIKKPEPVKVVPAAQLASRKIEKTEEIGFAADSLVIALYDNGEVDGDTVSVLLNGEIFWANQGLKSQAIKKTVYIPAGTDSLELVLYAENLGAYPPNTGLLIIYDGNERYMVRFSADFNRNARVVLRRKKE
ncbi:MAG: hypothetical protein SFU20_07695 [Chitinophagaceae bacterium]|nr:hypothetical protein [Chitinophagaceae bacterium]